MARAVSSVEERLVDIEEVAGSIPVSPISLLPRRSPPVCPQPGCLSPTSPWTCRRTAIHAVLRAAPDDLTGSERQVGRLHRLRRSTRLRRRLLSRSRQRAELRFGPALTANGCHHRGEAPVTPEICRKLIHYQPDLIRLLRDRMRTAASLSDGRKSTSRPEASPKSSIKRTASIGSTGCWQYTTA